MKRSRRPSARAASATGDDAPSIPTSPFAQAIAVLLARQSDYICGDGAWRCVISWLCVDRATNMIVQRWIRTIAEDVTRGHERSLRVPVRMRDGASTQWGTGSELIGLLRFRYATRVVLPRALSPTAHQLPPDEQDRQRKGNTLVRRMIDGCRAALYVAHSPIKGWGVFASAEIPTGTYLGEYTGELITTIEMRRRYETTYTPLGLNYVLALREHTAAGDVVRTNVDATFESNFTRFYNHSCEPTLYIEALRSDSYIPRLAFFARRHIEPHEELTFDYGIGIAASGEVKSSTTTIQCHCGSRHCRGELPFSRGL